MYLWLTSHAIRQVLASLFLRLSPLPQPSSHKILELERISCFERCRSIVENKGPEWWYVRTLIYVTMCMQLGPNGTKGHSLTTWITPLGPLPYSACWRTAGILTPWNRVLIEKITGSQIMKKFPAFYVTRSFITTFTSARQLSLSWARSVQSIPSHPISWRSILILSFHLRLTTRISQWNYFCCFYFCM
jgi:hypothetical protein